MARELERICSVRYSDFDIQVKFFKNSLKKHETLFSAEVDFGPFDKVIVDDFNRLRLEKKLTSLLPLSCYSRCIAAYR